jgi:epoxyqueuosine reductase QueG
MIELLVDLARQQGATLAGWAALDRGELGLYSLLNAGEAQRYRSALVIGVRHSDAALVNPLKLPTDTYDQEYRRLNVLLNQIISFLNNYLNSHGVAGRAVEASQTMDMVHQRGLVSHRALAERAGLGIRGRNNLLVTSAHRSRVRLATLLTDLPVPRLPKIVWPYPCTGCDACRKACPAGAIGERSDDFRLDLCIMHMDRFHKQDLSTHICGICLAICPGIELV